MKLTLAGFGFLGAICISVIYNSGVYAEVKPDNTLNTAVSGSSNYTITDGTRVGNNLFHSFSQFSIPINGSASFDNATDIQNIFSRVTGGDVSKINGSISAKGNANLFLLNPAGIIFGASASLNIGGSFVGTTANSIKFPNGIEFSAVNVSGTPLLTMSAPIGLQMGSNPQPITVQGTGYALKADSSLSPITQNPSSSQLMVKPGKTLALVGGNINLTGATLNAPQGRVELGSLSGVGLVSLNPIAQGYQLGYESGQSFADIHLSQKSLLTIGALPSVGAFNAGSVQLQGKHIQISDGSIIFSKNLGNVAGGEIFLQASEGIDIVGTTANAQIRSGIRSEGLNTGTGSSIHIITPQLSISQGAGVNNNAFGLAGSGASGNIQIDAGTVELSGFAPINPTGVTSLTTSTRTAKSAGNLSINTNNLVVSGGAAIASVTFATGSTGQVTIRSKNTTVTGDNPTGLYSNIGAITYGTGNAQTLTLDTNRLQLLNGGVVATTSFLIGQAGNLHINATESILIDGHSQVNNSSINSAVLYPPALIQKLFKLPNVLSANAGTVNVTTPNLMLTNGGAVSVTNQGKGDGGNINIIANNIQLKNQSLIQAQTKSGNGGNINLQTRSLLLLRDNSQITSTASGNGNGGNININAPILVGLENSDIIANAVQGKGGNIAITTQGIIGLKFRDTLTPRKDLTNDITASSAFNVNGTVAINNVGVDPNSGLVELPANVSDPSQQIASGCSANPSSSFVATGRGGIPQNPTQEIRSDRTWSDIRDISAFHTTQPVKAQTAKSPETLVQATSWRRNAQGKIELIANQSSSQVQPKLTCAALPTN
ncbi:S-layer family protein [Nostoc sp. FACHB-280]|uniref:two-partner secretion domain-containing protein n=1 Tax=Nostoc sp. FACHB-280 TaxID=2692839 RepID=UPI00168A42E5|nr:S-layer family protein [Nostoc sp. FACHB-280]MBD2492887.1 S-layer family protein [Nostoc sp. FACHB-280]